MRVCIMYYHVYIGKPKKSYFLSGPATKKITFLRLLIGGTATKAVWCKGKLERSRSSCVGVIKILILPQLILQHTQTQKKRITAL